MLLSATYTGLGSFTGTTGTGPSGAIAVGLGGEFLGTAGSGGAYGDGTVYGLNVTSGAVTAMASFNGADGAQPVSGLVAGPGYQQYFGTTRAGGTAGEGTIFVYDAGTATITRLASFTPTTGQGPTAGALAIDAHGDLFGTTTRGGPDNDGTVFELAAGSGTITTVAAFNGTNGRLPAASVDVDAQGNLFGTTEYGGAADDGTAFEIPAGTGTVSTLVSFDGANGAHPTVTPVLGSNGNLYGATAAGGTANDGVVFYVPAAAYFQAAYGTSSCYTLVNFSGGDGAGPGGSLDIDNIGNLFGTTTAGGTGGDGTVYEVMEYDRSLVTLASLPTAGDSSPGLCVVHLGDQYTLYGTTTAGGAANGGSAFAVVPVVATRAVVTAQPTSAVAGASFSLTVHLVDATGDVDTNYLQTLQLSIASGPAGATLGATSTVLAIGGVAVFPVVVTVAGTYTFTVALPAISPAIAPVTTAPVRVTAAAAVLRFTQAPANVVAGQTMPSVEVTGLDAYGNAAPNGDVLSVVAVGPGGITDAALLKSAMVGGQASLLHDASLSVAGTWTLHVTDLSNPSVAGDSLPFTVAPAVPRRLAIAGPSTPASAGSPLGPVTVRVEDDYGNVVTTDDSTVSITGAGLSRTTTAQAQAGVAVFSDLSIAAAGADRLTATDGPLAVALITTVAAPTTTSVTTPTVSAVAGRTVGPITVDVPATDAPGKVTVRVVRRSDGQTMRTRQVAVHGGHATLSGLTLNRSDDYTVTFSAGDAVVATQTIRVTGAAAARLAFAAPAVASAGGQVVSVQVLDRYGNITAAADGRVVTLHVRSARAETVTATIALGVATFGDVTVTRGPLIADAAGLRSAATDVLR